MPTLDHRKLDARHKARLEVASILEAYKRRILDDAYTAIDAAIQTKDVRGEAVSGAEIGREETIRVIAGYITGEPQPAIEAGGDPKV